MANTARVTNRHTISHAKNLFHGNAQHPGANGSERGVPMTPIVQIDMGVPITADADGIAASQDVTVGTTPLAVINGALASGGVATFDVPRNVVAAWTGTAVLTVTGTDEYGARLVESSASGTSLAGKKAFKTITSASFSADVTAATIGSGNVLGLPYKLAGAFDILAKFADATADTTGTVVAAVTTDPATATTGDVRGTIDWASDPDGSRRYRVWMKIADPDSRSGAFGVTQFGG